MSAKLEWLSKNQMLKRIQVIQRPQELEIWNQHLDSCPLQSEIHHSRINPTKNQKPPCLN